MRQVRVIYLEDFDEAVGLAISDESGVKFRTALKFYKPLEKRVFKTTHEVAEAAYAVATAQPARHTRNENTAEIGAA